MKKMESCSTYRVSVRCALVKAPWSNWSQEKTVQTELNGKTIRDDSGLLPTNIYFLSISEFEFSVVVETRSDLLSMCKISAELKTNTTVFLKEI